MGRTLIIENGCELEADFPAFTALSLTDDLEQFLSQRMALVRQLQKSDRSLKRITFDALAYGYAFDSDDESPLNTLPPFEEEGAPFRRNHWVVNLDQLPEITEFTVDVFNFVVDEDSFFVRASGRHDDFYFETAALGIGVLSEPPVELADVN